MTTIKKYQKYVRLNIANEAGADTVSQNNFLKTYSLIIKKMRNGGIHVPLIIDAANWGRNESYLVINGKALLAADPEHNLTFSWHIWDSGITESRISKGIVESIQLNINLLIAEFAPLEVKCKCCIPYKFIMQCCQQKSIGWLSWSRGVGNADCPAMDMIKTAAFNSLFGWGLEVAVISKYSIKNTAKKRGIF